MVNKYGSVFDAGIKPLQQIMGIVADDDIQDGDKLEQIRQIATDGVVDIYAVRKASDD